MRILIFVFLFIPIFAQDQTEKQKIKNAPVHEAFIIQESGLLLHRYLLASPPTVGGEPVPELTHKELVWIPGYWDWSDSHQNFLWISGTWRRPPPGHHWIAGYWKEYPKGWVRIPGFWSKSEEKDLQYRDQMPPDPIDEPVADPLPKDPYFRIVGYWKFDDDEQTYIWHKGRWELIKKEWILIPAHYVWRDEGYLFLPAFWDWPIEERGVVYASVSNPIEDKGDPLDPLYVMESYFPVWPNYASLFSHHFHSHMDEWKQWGSAPPWWKWEAWWGFAPVDQWYLWWWWTHSKMPTPRWLDKKILANMTPAPRFVIKMMGNQTPPLNISSLGVVGDRALLRASKEKLPILTTQRAVMRTYYQETKPRFELQRLYLRPSATISVNNQSKPQFGPTLYQLKKEPRRVEVPDLPNVEKKEFAVPQEMKKKTNNESLQPIAPQLLPTLPKGEPLLQLSQPIAFVPTSSRPVNPAELPPNMQPPPLREPDRLHPHFPKPREIPHALIRPDHSLTRPPYTTIRPPAAFPEVPLAPRLELHGPPRDPRYRLPHRQRHTFHRRPGALPRPPTRLSPQYLDSPRLHPSYPHQPYQGSQAYYPYPQLPMQSRPQDRIMGYSHPLRNPPGPRPHPLPGFETTIQEYKDMIQSEYEPE